MIVGNYLSHVDDRIVERGEAYFDSGRVGPLEELAPGLWHAVVRGTEDYHVDIRVRHDAIISTACSCPYAQRSSHCKHIIAVILALEAGKSSFSELTPQLPRDASFAVRNYAIMEFPQHPTLDDDDWKAIRHIMERLYGFPDLEQSVVRAATQAISESRDEPSRKETREGYRRRLHSPQTARERELTRLKQSEQAQTETLTQLHETATQRTTPGNNATSRAIANMRILVPFFQATHIDQLPHTWMTILEAAYEHLHDRDGLRRLYSYYIITARTEPESVYVRRLREMSGSDWPEDRDAIVRIVNEHAVTRLISPRNPAYERMLREDRLGKTAYDYCRRGLTDAALIRLLDVIANDPDSSDKAKARILDILTNPDSAVFAEDTPSGANRIARWMHRIDNIYGYDEAAVLSEEIVSMFPHRTALHNALHLYLHHDDDIAATSAETTNTGDDHDE